MSGNTITVSKFEGLNLNQYSLAKAENCRQYHAVCKSGCKEMVDAANDLLQKKWIPLPKLWRTCFSLKRYDCEKAQRRLLQMPVACIRLKNGVVVIEKNSDNCYHGVISEINQIYDMLPLTDNAKKEDPIRKDECQDLLKSATSTSEVQKIKHVIASTHNMSQREAQRLGIRRLKQRAAQVEGATETVKNIRSKHNYFAKLEQKAFLHTQGLDFEFYLSSDSSDSSEWDSEDEEVIEIKEKPSSHTLSASLDIEERLEKSDTEKGAANDKLHVELNKTQSISCSTTECTSQEQQGNSLQQNISDLHGNTMLVLDILKDTRYNWYVCMYVCMYVKSLLI